MSQGCVFDPAMGGGIDEHLLQKIETIFRQFDRDGKGSIPIKDLECLISQCLSVGGENENPRSTKVLVDLFTSLDTTGSGKIPYEQIIQGN